MAKWEGFAPGLRTPADLFGKLRRDLARLERDPNDEDAAWDFFITAHHMREWTGLHEPPTAEPARVIWQLANKAKHFYPENQRPPTGRRVLATGSQGAFQADAFQPDAFDTVRLVVELDSPHEVKSALELAREAVAFWEREMR